MLGQTPSRLSQPWLHLRYAEAVGTRLTRYGFRAIIPTILLSFGSTAFLGILLFDAAAEGNAGASSLFGVLALLALLHAATRLRMLIGYLRPDRYPVVLDLWSDSGPEHRDEAPQFGIFGRTALWSESAPNPEDAAPQPAAGERIRQAVAIAVLWLLAVSIWLVDLLLLGVFVFGGLSPGGVAGS